MLPRFALLLLIAPAFAGCGEDLGYMLPVHPTAGKIASKGRPVKNAIVRFHPVDPKSVELPAGKKGPIIVLTTSTNADGEFVMSTYYTGDGIPAGTYTVTVAPRIVTGNADAAPAPSADASSSPPVGEDTSREDLTPAERIKKPAKPALATIYSDPATSPLKATVKPGEKNDLSFELDAA
jgi:hypothetical protein